MVPRFVLLAFDPNPSRCGDCRHSIHTIVSRSSKGQKRIVSTDITCVILKHCDTVVCHAGGDVHMPIMRSAVLSVSHSGAIVPDPHDSVSESGDIEILNTHVS